MLYFLFIVLFLSFFCILSILFLYSYLPFSLCICCLYLSLLLPPFLLSNSLKYVLSPPSPLSFCFFPPPHIFSMLFCRNIFFSLFLYLLFPSMFWSISNEFITFSRSFTETSLCLLTKRNTWIPLIFFLSC